jgi:hypothetical protein
MQLSSVYRCLCEWRDAQRLPQSRDTTKSAAAEVLGPYGAGGARLPCCLHEFIVANIRDQVSMPLMTDGENQDWIAVTAKHVRSSSRLQDQ